MMLRPVRRAVVQLARRGQVWHSSRGKKKVPRARPRSSVRFLYWRVLWPAGQSHCPCGEVDLEGGLGELALTVVTAHRADHFYALFGEHVAPFGVGEGMIPDNGPGSQTISF